MPWQNIQHWACGAHPPLISANLRLSAQQNNRAEQDEIDQPSVEAGLISVRSLADCPGLGNNRWEISCGTGGRCARVLAERGVFRGVVKTEIWSREFDAGVFAYHHQVGLRR